MMARKFPEWDVFKTKANGACRDRFEDLCRMLFCNELGIGQGTLVTIKNQAGNETELVYCNNKKIGFQCKFFDHQLNLQKFKDSISKAKKYNPDQEVIYLYSNADITLIQKKNLNTCVENFGMKCVIRFNKQILDKVADSEDILIYENFFHIDSPTEKVIETGKDRTSSYLKDIQTEIPFGKGIVLKREKELRALDEILSKNDIAIVIGHGGCGKSSLVKMYFEQFKEDDIAVRIYRGERFNKDSINDMLVEDHKLFFEAYDSFEKKFFVIDSAEQIVLRKKSADELSLLFRMLDEHHWRIILTCRIEESGLLLSFVQDKTEHMVCSVEVNRLTEKYLQELSNLYRFNLPTDRLLRDYIQIPMELKEYLSQKEDGSQMTYTDFKQREWSEKICGIGTMAINKAKEKFILDLAKALYVDKVKPSSVLPMSQEDIIDSLIEEHILTRDEDQEIRFCHDLYGEWAVTELLERSYKETPSLIKLYSEYGNTVTGCRCFRQWVSDKIGKNPEIDLAVCETLESTISENLQNELITAVLQSDEVEVFMKDNSQLLLRDNSKILNEMLFWLPISCVYISKDELFGKTSPSIEPNGKGWDTVISFVFNLGVEYWLSHYNDIQPVILLWSKAHGEGETAKKCGDIALELLNQTISGEFQLLFYKLIPVIYRTAIVIKEKLDGFIRAILAKDHIKGDTLYRHILEFAVKESDIGNYRLARSNPQLMMDIWDYCWHGGHIDVERYSFGDYYSYGLDRSFSISTTDDRFQTSIVYLLMAGNQFVLEYFPKFLDQAVSCYMQKIPQTHQLEEIEIELKGERMIQRGNEELWCAYRNGIMSNVPDLIVSLLIDLHWYLDFVISNGTADCNFMRKLILSSKNVMITAVVTAVVLKHLDVCSELADELSKTVRLKELDKHRWATEFDSRDVGFSAELSVRVSFYDRNIQLKKNAYKIQEISLDNYNSGDIRPPMSAYDAIMKGETMSTTRWICRFFEGKGGSYEEVAEMLKEAREELEKYPVESLSAQLSISYVDGIAPAYILLCNELDDNARWCKEFILHMLRESDSLYNPAAMYDGVGYCIRAVPKLLDLFGENRQEIFDSVLMASVNIRDRINARPLDEIIVEMIREGALWEKYRSEMENFVEKFRLLCEERNGRLRPIDVSLALRMLPMKDLGFSLMRLKMKLMKELFRYGEDEVHGNYLTARQLSEPVAETLLCEQSFWTRYYTKRLLKKSIRRNRVSEAHLTGLIHEAEITGETDRFFALWIKLARNVYGLKKDDYHITRLKEILAFQDYGDVVERMKGNPKFCEESLQYMNILVSRYGNDVNVLKGLMLFADYSEEKELENWVGLIHQTIHKMKPRMISYAGISWLEDIMRKCQNVFGYGVSASYPPALRTQIIEILDKMICCRSSKAYLMREFCG